MPREGLFDRLSRNITDKLSHGGGESPDSGKGSVASDGTPLSVSDKYTGEVVYEGRDGVVRKDKVSGGKGKVVSQGQHRNYLGRLDC